MLVLIDESGDCGLKFGRGSSDFFTCVAVVFSTPFAADACDRSIDELRRRMNKRLQYEFHFTNCSGAIRTAFLRAMVSEEFRYAGFVVDKRKLHSERFNDPKEVYEFSVGIVCEHIRPLLNNSKIILDKSGDRAFRTKLEKGLKAQLTDADGSCLIKKVAMEHSHGNNLIQLADMVCGAVGRSITSGENTYRDLVRAREKFVQIWPARNK